MATVATRSGDPNLSRQHRFDGFGVRGQSRSSSEVTPGALIAEPSFSGESQTWHVIANGGAKVREREHPSPTVAVLEFAEILTVTHKQGRVIKISSPVVGYIDVVDSLNHLVVAKGGPEVGRRWRYRVVCVDGAFVREGMELTSGYICNLPFQSVVEVLERRINVAGLPRLRIADGWISEVLNPLSGQRGPVVEIVRLLRPLKFRVALDEGALVRRMVELASSEVKRLPRGEVFAVSAKQFSDLGSRCVQRLKLADGSGWLSMRLNKEPPGDTPIVEFVGVAEQRSSNSGVSLRAQQGRSGEAPDLDARRGASSAEGGGDADGDGENEGGLDSRLSPVVVDDDDDGNASERAELRKIKGREITEDDNCVVCLNGLRTATIVHGEIGHIACCLECARILKVLEDTPERFENLLVAISREQANGIF